MRTHNKTLSALLGTAMLLSSASFLSGCNSAKAAKKITSDSLWYDSTTVEGTTGYNEDELEYAYFGDCCAYEDRIFTVFEGYRKSPSDDEMTEDFDYQSLSITELYEYDMEGNLISTYDLNELIGYSWISSMYAADEGINFIISTYDDVTYEDVLLTLTFNVENESFSEPEVINLGNASGNQYPENIVSLSNGAMLASIYTYEGDQPSYIYNIIENGEVVKTIDFSKEFNQIIYDMQTFFNDEEGNLISLGSADSGTLVYKLDINTYEVTDVTPENSSELDVYSYRLASDGQMYKVDSEGVKKLNATTFEEEAILPFTACNVNLYNVTSNSVINVSDDVIVLAGTSFKAGSNISTFSITQLTKADKNPNAGKLNLVIGLVDVYLDEALGDAIYEFNASNEECFATVKNYSSYEHFNGTENMSDEEYQKAYMDASATMTNDLAIELMSGEGPDIIMGTVSYTQLNNSDYLKDLTDLVGELDSSSYFMNVFDAAKTGDKIFQLPLTFIVSGIACETKYAPSNGIGFTISEYGDFVSNVCNGTDPNISDRSYYFINGISQMGDLFIDNENKKVDFCQDTFYDFAEYCLNNVPETVDWDAMYDNYGYLDTGSDSYASMTHLYDLTSYGNLTANGNKDIGVYGVCADGRGPSIQVYSSVAVSATTVSKEGAYEFVRTLLSDDVQYLMAKNYSNSVNKDALYEASLEIVEDANETFEAELNSGVSEEALISWGICRLDESMIDGYFETLEKGSYIVSMDSAVGSIILEEIPAYFAGQKSIEDVAAVINNRAQTVLNER